jgi:DNA-binding FrmR family transcriptional regulator
VQFRAVHSALKAVEAPIFEKHVRHCVAGAAQSKQAAELDEKVLELVDLFSKN